MRTAASTPTGISPGRSLPPSPGSSTWTTRARTSSRTSTATGPRITSTRPRTRDHRGLSRRDLRPPEADHPGRGGDHGQPHPGPAPRPGPFPEGHAGLAGQPGHRGVVLPPTCRRPPTPPRESISMKKDAQGNESPSPRNGPPAACPSVPSSRWMVFSPRSRPPSGSWKVEFW